MYVGSLEQRERVKGLVYPVREKDVWYGLKV